MKVSLSDHYDLLPLDLSDLTKRCCHWGRVRRSWKLQLHLQKGWVPFLTVLGEWVEEALSFRENLEAKHINQTPKTHFSKEKCSYPWVKDLSYGINYPNNHYPVCRNNKEPLQVGLCDFNYPPSILLTIRTRESLVFYRNRKFMQGCWSKDKTKGGLTKAWSEEMREKGQSTGEEKIDHRRGHGF